MIKMRKIQDNFMKEKIMCYKQFQFEKPLISYRVNIFHWKSFDIHEEF